MGLDAYAEFGLGFRIKPLTVPEDFEDDLECLLDPKFDEEKYEFQSVTLMSDEREEFVFLKNPLQYSNIQAEGPILKAHLLSIGLTPISEFDIVGASTIY